MARRDWPDHETDALRDEIAGGVSPAEIARRHGRPLGSVRNKIQREQVGPLQQVRAQLRQGRTSADESPDVAEWQARRVAAVAEVETKAEVYDWLRPVTLPAPPPLTKPKLAASPRTLIAGDFHFPVQDDAAVEVFLQTVAALRPQRVILNGDTVDLLAVSRYPKDARHGMTWALRDEVAAFHGFLHRLHAIGAPWGLEVVETNANHSGNGTAGRWWRYLSDRCPELLGHAGAADMLAYERWFYPTWSSITLVDHVVIADDLVVMHGELVRQQGAYSARGHVQKYHASVLHNHTHRVGFSPHRVPAIDGLRGEAIVRGYENGCLCKLEPVYGRGMNWQQGFAIVTHHPDGDGRYGVEQVLIDRGRAVVGALGGELAA